MKQLVFLSALAIVMPAYAEVFYDIDFESPVHAVGSIPVTGSGPETPSSIVFGKPLIQQGFGPMDSQCLVFNQTSSTYNQIELDLGKGRDLYFLSFDIVTRNIDDSLLAFTVFFDTPQVRTFSFHGLGTVDGSVNNYHYDYSDETLMHVAAVVDLAQSNWMVRVNGQLALDGHFTAQYGDIDSIRLNLSPWHGSADYDPSGYVAIDNLYVADTVPEPCSLILLGLGALMLSREGRHPRKVGQR